MESDAGALLLTATFLFARRRHGVRVAVVATALVAVSPVFLFNAASFFAHTVCAVLIVGSAYAGVRAIDEQRTRWAAVAAALLGVAFLTRNYTAAWCALPFAIALTRQGRFGWRTLAIGGE